MKSCSLLALHEGKRVNAGVHFYLSQKPWQRWRCATVRRITAFSM